MLTSRQCLEKAVHCERLADKSSSLAAERWLLETAKQWRNLAVVPRPKMLVSGAKAASMMDDRKVATLLSEVACPIR